MTRTGRTAAASYFSPAALPVTAPTPDEFRRAMALVPTPVTVVTAPGDAGRRRRDRQRGRVALARPAPDAGLPRPPIAHARAPSRSAGRFAVNVLGAEAEGHARTFATPVPHTEKWEGVPGDRALGRPDPRRGDRLGRLRAPRPPRRRRPHDRHRHGRRARLAATATRSSSSTAPTEPEQRLAARTGAPVVPAARSARKKTTSAETAMIPVSRRKIARATRRWRSLGSASKSIPSSSRAPAPARAASASIETKIGRTP